MKNVLFLCTGNSCRSIMAEGLLNHYGNGKYKAFSAGSFPIGQAHPMALATLQAKGIELQCPRSKSWDEFTDKHIDLVITVCDDAAGEACPMFHGSPIKAHWGVPDPAHFEGTEEEINAEFERVFRILETRVKALVALPKLNTPDLANTLNNIGKYE